MLWNNLELPPAYYQDDAVYIIHGDCREILPLIPDKSIDLVQTDIPYNISQESNGLRELDYGSWDYDFDIKTLELLPRLLNGGRFYIWCGDEQLSGLLLWLKGLGYLTRTLAWAKRNPTILNGDKIWLPSQELCAYGKYPRALFSGHCELSYNLDSPDNNRLHPTQKPALIIQRQIGFSTNSDALILDPFLGSGTTAYCAKKLGRKCIGIEIEEKYCHIAAERCRQSVMNLGI